MNNFTEALAQALIHFLWQGVLVAVILYIALILLRSYSAKLRYMCCCLAMLVLAALPIINLSLFYQETNPPNPIASDNASFNFEQLMENFFPPINESIVKLASTKLSVVNYRWLLLRCWFIGVFIFSLRLLLAYSHAWRMCRRARVVESSILLLAKKVALNMGLDRAFRVMVSASTDSPAVIGWIKPVILLPPTLVTGMDPDQLEAVLAHEIAHIKRFDYLANLLQSIVEVVFFYHPAVWWVSRQIRKERELCCDDLAVSYSDNVVGYARSLTHIEKIRLQSNYLVVGVSGYCLTYRVRRLLGMEISSSNALGLVAALIILLTSSLAINTLLTFDSRAQDQIVEPTPAALTDEQIKQQLLGEWYGEFDTPAAIRTVVYRFMENESGELEAFIVNNPNNPHTLTTKIYNFTVENGDVVMERLNYQAQAEGRFVGFKGKFTGNAIVGEITNRGDVYPLTLKKGRYSIPVISVYSLDLSDFAKELLRGNWRSETQTKTVVPPELGQEQEIKNTLYFNFEDTKAGDFVGTVQNRAEFRVKGEKKIERKSSPWKITEASLIESELKLTLRGPKARFVGDVSKNLITGQWTIGNQTIPLELTKQR